MDPRALLVKNVSHETPGRLLDVLSSHGIASTIVDLNAGSPFPDPTEFNALFVFGGPDSANDSTPKMREELSRIKQAIDADVPFFGVCLGMQALVKACGGSVHPAPKKEIGYRNPEGLPYAITLTETGRADPLFAGLPDDLPIFHLHGETVDLPSNMELLAEGRDCVNQVVRVKGKRAYGFQGHVELTPGMLEEWLEKDEDLKKLDANAVREDEHATRPLYEEDVHLIVGNFLEIAGLA